MKTIKKFKGAKLNQVETLYSRYECQKMANGDYLVTVWAVEDENGNELPFTADREDVAIICALAYKYAHAYYHVIAKAIVRMLNINSVWAE